MTPKLIEPGAKTVRTREIPIHGAEFLVGRGTDCDLRLHDPNVSRHHCLIHVRPRDITLTDLGSSNGTFVNGHRIFSQVILQAGDEIRLGEFRFFLDLGEGSDKIPSQAPEVDPLAQTFRLDRAKEEMRPDLAELKPQKEESHPQGEAGGEGNVG